MVFSFLLEYYKVLRMFESEESLCKLMQMSANDQFKVHVIKLLLDPWNVICPSDWLPVFHL